MTVQLPVPPAALHIPTHLQPDAQWLFCSRSHLRSTYSRGLFLLLSHLDVNSWLLTFGFQLHNVIPGYPKPDMDAMEPSYELIHTQMKTQEWDNSKVIHAHGCPPLGPLEHYRNGSHQLFRKAWADGGASTVPARNCPANM